MDVFDVVVVGLGPVGGVAANLLVQYGLRVLVVERSTEIVNYPRAAALDDEAVRIIQNLNCGKTNTKRNTSSGDREDVVEGLNNFWTEGELLQRSAQLVNRNRGEDQSRDKIHLLWELPSVPRETNGWNTLNFFYQPRMDEKLRTALIEQRATTSMRVGWQVADIVQIGEDVALSRMNEAARIDETARLEAMRNRRKKWTDQNVACEYAMVTIVPFQENESSRDSVAKEETYITRYVLGCDGGSSTVRHLMGSKPGSDQQSGKVEFSGASYTKERWLVVDAAIDVTLQRKLRLGDAAVHKSSAFFYKNASSINLAGGSNGTDPAFQFICDPVQSGAQMALGCGHYRWEFNLCTEESEEGARIEAEAMKSDNLCKLLKKRGVKEEHFRAHIWPNIKRMVVYTFHTRVATQWSGPARTERGLPTTPEISTLVLAGDAAHMVPPFTGQGLCSGLRDAFNVCWKIKYAVEGHAHPSIFEAYEEERKPHVERVMKMSYLLGRLIMLRNSTLAYGRDLIMLVAQRLPVVVRLINGDDIFRPLSQLNGGLIGAAYGTFLQPSTWKERYINFVRRNLRLPYRFYRGQAGNLFIQPIVRLHAQRAEEDTSMRRTLLDEVLARDGRFTLLVRDTALWSAESLSSIGQYSISVWRDLDAKIVVWHEPDDGKTHSEKPAPVQGLDYAWVEDTTGALKRYFDTNHCDLVIIRPDRFVYATLVLAYKPYAPLSNVAINTMGQTCARLHRSLTSAEGWKSVETAEYTAPTAFGLQLFILIVMLPLLLVTLYRRFA